MKIPFARDALWVLLAISFFMSASRNETLVAWANPVAAAGGLMYLLFIVNFLRL